MANIDDSKLRHNDKQENNNKNTTKVVIITSVDDGDDEKILSYLNPSNIKTFIVDLNDLNQTGACQINNNQSSSLLV